MSSVVASPLAPYGIGFGQDAGGDELLQAIAEDVRRDALDRPVQQLADLRELAQGYKVTSEVAPSGTIYMTFTR